MKKLLRILLILVIIIALAAGSFAIFLKNRGTPKYEAKDPGIHIQSTPARVDRGRIIANLLCADCHKDNVTGMLTGKDMNPRGVFPFGIMNSRNITHDKTYGIGDWTDGQIIYLLRTGVKRDGYYAPPWMAKLPHMSDEDIASVVSFLRSDDPMVKAASIQDKPCEPNLFADFLMLVAFHPLPYPDKPIPQPDTTNKVAWGQYLVWNMDCYTCHSADFSKIDAMDPTKSAGYMGGGNLLDAGLVGCVEDNGRIYSANLTPDKETGIGKWSEGTFLKAFRFGQKPDGSMTRLPMKPYVMLSESEAKAIYAYLQTVPPIHNVINRAIVH
jgi:hypothetical protein